MNIWIGPLGITLRRRDKTGIVFVHEIISDSQAVELDINVNDELWGVGSTEIGNNIIIDILLFSYYC